MLNKTAIDANVTLLLDEKFRSGADTKVLFHPMTNDHTTSISSAELEKLLTEVASQTAGKEFVFVDFEGSDAEISLEGGDAAAAAAPAKKEEPKKKEAPKPKKDAVKKQQTFADDHLFVPTMNPKDTPFGIAFERYAKANAA